MANQEHLDDLKKGVESWNQWRKEYPDVEPDLSGENLMSKDVVGDLLWDNERDRLNLGGRIIYLTPDETKERDWKMMPIREELVPIFQEAMKVTSLETDRVFLIRDRKGVRPPSEQSIKNPWRKACKAMGLDAPLPRFNDLRHTWRANARRSKVDWVIAGRIMGHSCKKLTVNEMYGDISDEELLEAIDSMTFDNGSTWVLGCRYDVDDKEEEGHNF